MTNCKSNSEKQLAVVWNDTAFSCGLFGAGRYNEWTAKGNGKRREKSILNFAPVHIFGANESQN